MRDVVFGIRGRVASLAIQVRVDFARGDGNLAHHIALLQQPQRQFAAHRVAVDAVIDSLRGQCLRQLLQ